jgi:hypothetical protein
MKMDVGTHPYCCRDPSRTSGCYEFYENPSVTRFKGISASLFDIPQIKQNTNITDSKIRQCFLLENLICVNLRIRKPDLGHAYEYVRICHSFAQLYVTPV